MFRAHRLHRLLGPTALFVLAACGGEDGSGIGPVVEQVEGPTSPAGPEGAATGEEAALTVAIDGAGFVSSDPPGIACPGTCTARFPKGTMVSLVPSPAEGWRLESCTTCALALEEDRVARVQLALLDPRWDPSVGAADCADAWGAAGEGLSTCDETKDDYVVVHKSKRNIALCTAGALVKNFRTGLGFAPVGPKQKEGDGKTPEGVFYIPRRVPESDFHRALLLSYPSREDALRGAAAGLVTTSQKDQILAAHDACKEPPQSTPLGGLIEIYGEGSDDDWTSGCMALDNEDMDALWKRLGVGDTIVVLP